MASAALRLASLIRGAAVEFRPAEQKYTSGERVVKRDCVSYCAEEQGGQKPYVKTYLPGN